MPTEVIMNSHDLVTSLSEDLVLKHERNEVNTRNNRAFALLTERGVQLLVEVVRRGEKNTRIRRGFDTNTPTELVPVKDLTGYTHKDGRP